MVIMLIGRIASGKTFIAKRMKKKKPAVLLSCDKLMLTLFDDCLGEHHNAMQAKCHRYLFGLSKEISASGSDVILDFGFWTKEQRRETEDYYRAANIKLKRIYIVSDEEERKKRLKKRNEAVANAEGRHYIITPEMLERFDSVFEKPEIWEYDELYIN